MILPPYVNITTEFTDTIFPYFLEIMFNGKVEWEGMEPQIPTLLDIKQVEKAVEKTEEVDFETETYLINVHEFIDARDHYLLKIEVDDFIELKGKLRPSHFKTLMSKLELALGEFEFPKIKENGELVIVEDYFFPHWELLYKVYWTKDEDGHITGMNFYFCDVPDNWSWDYPFLDRGILEPFIAFWDTLQELKREVQNNVRFRRTCFADKKRRFRIRGGKGFNLQDKTDKPGFSRCGYPKVAGL